MNQKTDRVLCEQKELRELWAKIEREDNGFESCFMEHYGAEYQG